MLEQKIIRNSYSPWSAPVWIVPKKIDASGKQKWRLVFDFRKLSEKTISDRYPILNINEILDKLGRCMYFTTLDLASGFHQVEMHPKDNVLHDLIGKICLVYLDDIVIFATSLEEHIQNIRADFKKLREANFKIQLDKSEFLKKEIEFLGHIVSTNGIKPNPSKIQAIKNYPIPKTQKEIKSFLGLIGYYRKFMDNFAKIVKPLTACLKKGRKVVLTKEYTDAFELCKNLLQNDPILQYPDFSKPFVVTTDASDYALGAVLSQGPIGSDNPICYASRTLSDAEIRYSAIEKELLAIIWALKYFKPYIYGRKFKIVTDHKPLTSDLKSSPKIVRWRLYLEEYDYEFVHKKGKDNTNADSLSRIKISNTPDTVEVNINDNIGDNSSAVGTSGSTVHSNDENINNYICISEKPLNEFNLQLILAIDESPSISLELPFRNKQRRIVKDIQFNDDKILDILKKYCYRINKSEYIA